MIEKIKSEVKLLMGNDTDGHGFEHVMRVYTMAMDIAKQEQANPNIVGIAALLHDVDDYKLFGKESAEKLINARHILKNNNIDDENTDIICNIIQNMGYSRALKGIRPQTLEGRVVSDADMLDAIGANSVIRTLSYTITKGSRAIFNPEFFPESNLSIEAYNAKGRQADSFVNHFFDKLLKLKNMMFTKSAYEEAVVRHKIMVDFLRNYFREMNCPEWIAYLDDYEDHNSKAKKWFKDAV